MWWKPGKKRKTKSLFFAIMSKIIIEKKGKRKRGDRSHTLTPVGSLRYCTQICGHLEEMRNVVFLLFPGRASRHLGPIKHPESWGHWDQKHYFIKRTKPLT